MTTDQPVIMIIAGGEWQVPLVQKAKEYGAYVVNSNLYADSPGFQYADAGVVADVRDIERNLEIARQYSPDAVVTDQSDIAVPTVARICEELDLPGIGVDVAGCFTSKPRMRKICRDIGHPAPQFAVCETVDQLRQFSSLIDSSFVVKPTDSQSSRGVRKVDAGESVAEAFADAVQYSSDETVLAEGFIPGTELTVEGISVDGKHTSLATSVKHHFGHNPMVADQLLYSTSHPDFDLEKLHRQHNQLVEAMQLPFGLTHAEYKFFDGEFYLIEVAARGGGTKVASHIAPYLSGIDTYQLLFDLALGRNTRLLQPLQPSTSDRAAILRFFEFSAGRVRQIDGVEQARSIEGVMDVHLNFDVGSTLTASNDDRSRHMHVIGVGKDTQTVQHVAQLAYEQIAVAYE